MAISLSSLGVNIDRLFHGAVAPAGATLYTAPGSTTARTQVTSGVIANPSPAALKVRLGLIPSGGSNDGTHYLIGDQSIPANSSLILSDLGITMRPGDSLHATSDPLPPPSSILLTGSTTGGTLAANTYYYQVTATNSAGESVGQTEVTVTTTGSTSSVAVSWPRALGATGYKVYRSTAGGAEAPLATVSGGTTLTYSDTGSATSGGTVPTTGTAAGCIFTICGAEIPA